VETEAFWAGEFGKDYTARNRVAWRDRIPFWQSAIEYCNPNTVLEVGCNAGWNLLAILEVDASIDCHGVDINAGAVNEAREQGITAEVGSALEIASKFGHESMDVVFTAGVLIHVPPDDLKRVMQQIIDTSVKYIIAVEYHAKDEEEVEYRGHSGKLWKRDYGKLYQDMGCTLISYGAAGGFSECQYWLMTKPGARDLEDRQELF
jgi:pseudaminic acid biosynthesis-associated methylase